MNLVNELRMLAEDFKLAGSPMILQTRQMHELLDRLEVVEKAWKISDQTVYDLTEKVIPNIQEKLAAAEKERNVLRTALEKIADWDSAWGPYPETNEAWRAMVIVTAREAVPRRGEKK